MGQREVQFDGMETPEWTPLAVASEAEADRINAQLIALINERRVALDWSKSELARRAGLTGETVLGALRGTKFRMSLKTACRLLAVMDQRLTVGVVSASSSEASSSPASASPAQPGES